MKAAVMAAVMLGSCFLPAALEDARAQTRPVAFTFTPHFGGYFFEGNQDLRDRLLLGGGLGVDFSDRFGMEAIFQYIDTENRELDNDMDVYVSHLNGLYYLSSGRRLVPYLSAGAGAIIFNPAGQESDTDFLLNYGAGLKYSLTDRWSLRGDVRHLVSFGSHNNNLSLAVGLTYHWGRREPPRAEVTPEPEPVRPAPEEPRVVTEEPKQQPEEVCVHLTVQFGFDRTEIDPAYHDHLKEVADFMNEHPEVNASIKGHTDSVGTEEYNLKLGERRAESVKRYLVRNFGIAAERITTTSYGEARPLATNETDPGRHLNRRATDVLCTFEVSFQKQGQ